MTVASSERYGLSGWLLDIPVHVPDDIRRYFLYWKIFFILAAAAHFSALIVFASAGVSFMAWFNVFSVTTFIVAFILLRRGHYHLPFWLAIIELVLHGIAATICLGPLTGFQCYVFLVLVLIFVQPFYRLRTSILLGCGVLASLLIVMLYVQHHPPIYQLTDFWMTLYMMMGWAMFPAIMVAMVLPFIAEARRAEKELESAYGESESLLLNILPKQIAERLKQTSGMIADDHEEVAIMFADIVDFTTLSGRLPPAELVDLLNNVFNACDELADKYGVEKIKTIGDAYMVVAGVPMALDRPETILAHMALDMIQAVSKFKLPGTNDPVLLRIGINSGRVVAGVIGRRKFAYDLWGDAVNVAARMEETSEPGRIQVPGDLADKLADGFNFEARGDIEVKGKGMMRTSFLLGEN